MSNEDIKIARLEEKYCSMEKEITEVKDVVVKIKDNHLEHLKDQVTNVEKNLGERMEKIENKISYYVGGGAGIIALIELISKFK